MFPANIACTDDISLVKGAIIKTFCQTVFVNVRIFVLFPNLSCNLQHATSPVKTMAPVLLSKVWPCVHVQKTGVGGYVITAPLPTAAPVLECQPCVMCVNKDTT